MAGIWICITRKCETMEKIIYNVVWVENDLSIVEGYQLRAWKRGIKLVHFSNWVEAEEELEARFNMYSAIILDANCSYGKEEMEESSFLVDVRIKLAEICTRRKADMPWYILSAGTMDGIDIIVKSVSRERNARNEIWGKVYYSKIGESDSELLFDNILRIASNNDLNRILYRFKETFDVLQDPDIMEPEAMNNMFPILKGIYTDMDPDFDAEIYYNQLRQQVEYIFRAAQKKNLLPETCLNSKGGLNLEHSRKFLSGCVEPILKYTLSDGESNSNVVFSGVLADTLEYLLTKILSTKSHTGSVRSSQFLMYGCALQLCALIEHFGDYIKIHNNPDENKKILNLVKDIQDLKGRDSLSKNCSDYEGKKYLLDYENGNFHCGNVFVNNTYSKYKGKIVVLRGVEMNQGSTKDKYPFKATSVELG